jgi:curved DNA-binding protein
MIMTMNYKDYYNILGVDRSADQEAVRRAYRKLAMQYHPDRNPGDKQAEERFKEINEAYQVLSDAQKRAHYDRLGSSYSDWQRRGGQGDFNWGDWFAGSPGGGGRTRVEYGDINDLFSGGFSEFFRSIFGGMGGTVAEMPRGRRSAPAYEQSVTISLEEAHHGATRLLQGEGRRIQVKIPAGAKTGTKVRVKGAAPGDADLYLKVDVANDPRFEREGNNLHMQTTVDVFTALLGGEAEVQTLGGKVKLTIPPGTQPDQVFRLNGRGMPQLRNPQSKGDLYVRIKVRLPRQLTDRQKKLLEEASRLKSS